MNPTIKFVSPHGNGDTIRNGQEIQCLSYVGFFLSFLGGTIFQNNCVKHFSVEYFARYWRVMLGNYWLLLIVEQKGLSIRLYSTSRKNKYLIIIYHLKLHNPNIQKMAAKVSLWLLNLSSHFIFFCRRMSVLRQMLS